MKIMVLLILITSGNLWGQDGSKWRAYALKNFEIHPVNIGYLGEDTAHYPHPLTIELIAQLWGEYKTHILCDSIKTYVYDGRGEWCDTVKTEWRKINASPTFEGFMEFLRKKYK